MDLLIAFVLFLSGVVLCLSFQVSILWALLIGLLIFWLLGIKRGFSMSELFRMAMHGASRSLIVLRIFLLIGLLTALWRSSGTIAYFVYMGVQIIPPNFFVVGAFLLTSLVAYALGTCFGVVSTIGVILMIIARSGGVNEFIAAGAIISGAYVGDRSAPTASSASIVALLTKSPLYENVRGMLITGMLPFFVTMAAYIFLSPSNPIEPENGRNTLVLLEQSFHLNLWMILPALIMFVLPLFRVEVVYTMSASIVVAFFLTIFFQDMGFAQLVYACFWGYSSDNTALAQILNGGGVFSMVQVAGIVLLSCAYAGIFEGTKCLDGLQEYLYRLTGKWGLFPVMLIVALLTSGFFCNQTIAIIMSYQLMGKIYEQYGATPYETAMDMENSVITIPGLVPWAIACTVPLNVLQIGTGALPYAIFLYAIPLGYALTRHIWFQKRIA